MTLISGHLLGAVLAQRRATRFVAERTLHGARRLAAELGDVRGEAQVLSTLIEVKLRIGDARRVRHAERLAKQGLQLILHLPKEEQTAAAGRFYSLAGQAQISQKGDGFDRAERSLQLAYESAEGDRASLTVVLLSMSWLAFGRRDYERAADVLHCLLKLQLSNQGTPEPRIKKTAQRLAKALPKISEDTPWIVLLNSPEGLVYAKDWVLVAVNFASLNAQITIPDSLQGDWDSDQRGRIQVDSRATLNELAAVGTASLYQRVL